MIGAIWLNTKVYVGDGMLQKSVFSMPLAERVSLRERAASLIKTGEGVMVEVVGLKPEEVLEKV